MQNYTVLTYIIGNYEVVHELEFDPSTTPHVEYLLITDDENLKSNTWTVVYDKELNKPELQPFDKVFYIRYNLFKYTNNDIVFRIDGSIGINKPVDNIIQTFIDGEYDGCLNIHPGRDNIIDECFAWSFMRDFPSLNTLFQIKFLNKKFKYDFNKKGLIELNISINKRGELTNEIDKSMQSLIIEGNLDNYLPNKNDKHYHVTRLDQTLFTALINTQFNDKKWMFIRDSLFAENGYLTWYKHGPENVKLLVNPDTFIDPYFNDNKANIVEF